MEQPGVIFLAPAFFVFFFFRENFRFCILAVKIIWNLECVDLIISSLLPETIY